MAQNETAIQHKPLCVQIGGGDQTYYPLIGSALTAWRLGFMPATISRLRPILEGWFNHHWLYHFASSHAVS